MVAARGAGREAWAEAAGVTVVQEQGQADEVKTGVAAGTRNSGLAVEQSSQCQQLQ